MSKRIHLDNYAPKYSSGKWSWDKKADRLVFEPHNDLENARERYIHTNGYRFLRTINQEEELIFREDFLRPPTTFDSDTVLINDIRDIVLFLMPPEFLTMRFLEFMHKPAVHRLIHALIIYFEYFLRMVEFVLIRRDELSGNMGQIQSEQTNDMKRTFSANLSQYRMLVARNYSVIVKGEGDMSKFYHMKEIVNISATIRDKFFHEQFLAVCIQMIWICMHRRAYYIIEMEMNRLFRSEHFIRMRPEYLTFTPSERSLLYGRNSKNVNYRAQISPLTQELQHVLDEDLPILWVGERKYRGTDARIAEIELEYITPGPQLQMIDVAHGILGNPKKLYNTLLELDWPSVRYANFSEQNDPYYIIRQPHLRIPNVDEQKMRKMAVHYEHFYKIFRIYEPCSLQTLMKWKRREKIINFYRTGGLLTSIWLRCEKDVATKTYGPNVQQIITNYFKVVSRLRKRNSGVFDDTVSRATEGTIGRKKAPVKQGEDRFFDDA